MDSTYVSGMERSTVKNNKRLIFYVTEDWYFCSHRLPLAIAAKKAGYDVTVATRIQKHGDMITRHGIHIIPVRLRRRSNNPFGVLVSLINIWRIYRRERPDVVHHVALKPVLIGSLATLFNRKIKVVNAIAGLGFVFTSRRLLAKILRFFLKIFLKVLLDRKASIAIIQNPDDAKLLIDRLGIKGDKVTLIKGAGVNLETYKVMPEPESVITISLVSRMLWDKGIGEFISAVELLKKQGHQFRALLAGSPDPDNPTSVSEEQLRQWSDIGIVEYIGHVDDVPKLWQDSNIAVLPSSYGEGIPKCLIEAAACGRPIVTTNTPGCREIVKDGVNGILIPTKDPSALATAMVRLIEDKELRKQMGLTGRKMVEADFSESIVIRKTLDIYEKLLRE